MRALVCGKKKFKIVNNRVIGRPDFPTQNLMSRQHFEVVEEDGRIFVKDLKSVNGTTLRGQKLQPNVAAELTDGDEIFAGGLTFKIALDSKLVVRERLLTASGIFALMFVALMCTPSVAFGRAIGFVGVAVVFASLAIPMGLSVLFLQKIEVTRSWSLVKFGMAIFVSTFALNGLLVGAIDEQTRLGETMSINKIHYFCVTKFQPAECTRQITSCPQCANQMGYDVRDEIVGRLQNYLRQPTAVKKR